MNKSDQFAIGVALLSWVLTVLLTSAFWAWVGLPISLFLICNPYIQDFAWGADRPDWREIQKMSADSYGVRLSDPKFERWVNHLSKPKKPKPILIVLVVLIPVLAVLSLRLPYSLNSSKQWKLEKYSVDSGYTFSREGVIYQAHCVAFFSAEAIKTLPPGFYIDSNASPQEGPCTVVLPYLHKPVPVRQGKPFGTNDLVFPVASDGSFNEGAWNFIITEAK